MVAIVKLNIDGLLKIGWVFAYNIKTSQRQKRHKEDSIFINRLPSVFQVYLGVTVKSTPDRLQLNTSIVHEKRLLFYFLNPVNV